MKLGNPAYGAAGLLWLACAQANSTQSPELSGGSADSGSAAGGAGDAAAFGGSPDAGGTLSPLASLPTCNFRSTPSTVADVSLLANNAPTRYEGVGVVSSIRRDGLSGPIYLVLFDLPGTEGFVEVSSNGREFPPFTEGQRVRIHLLESEFGDTTHVALIYHEDGSLLFADYAWATERITDGTVRELLGFDLTWEPGCLIHSGCATEPWLSFTPTLHWRNTRVALEHNAPVEIEREGRRYFLVWKSGGFSRGRPTGECPHGIGPGEPGGVHFTLSVIAD